MVIRDDRYIENKISLVCNRSAGFGDCFMHYQIMQIYAEMKGYDYYFDERRFFENCLVCNYGCDEYRTKLKNLLRDYFFKIYDVNRLPQPFHDKFVMLEVRQEQTYYKDPSICEIYESCKHIPHYDADGNQVQKNYLIYTQYFSDIERKEINKKMKKINLLTKNPSSSPKKIYVHIRLREMANIYYDGVWYSNNLFPQIGTECYIDEYTFDKVETLNLSDTQEIVISNDGYDKELRTKRVIKGITDDSMLDAIIDYNLEHYNKRLLGFISKMHRRGIKVKYMQGASYKDTYELFDVVKDSDLIISNREQSGINKITSLVHGTPVIRVWDMG